MGLHIAGIAALPLLVFGIAAVSSAAGPNAFSGNFSSDDQVEVFSFTLGAPATVTVRTWGYAGGVNASGTMVPNGGFDPVVSIFNAAGQLVNANDDGICSNVNQDPVTRNCFDSYLSIALNAGTYTVTLTQADNSANAPLLSDGFVHDGAGHFSCAEFLNQAGTFCDSSPARRTSAWALDIVGADAVAHNGSLGRRHPPRRL